MYKPSKFEWSWFWPFRVTHDQIEWCSWTPHNDFLLVATSNHMSMTNRLAAIAPRKTFSISDHWTKISDPSLQPTPATQAHPHTSAGFSQNLIVPSLCQREGSHQKWDWLVEYFLGYSLHRHKQKHGNKPLAGFNNNNVQELQLYLTPVVCRTVHIC